MFGLSFPELLIVLVVALVVLGPERLPKVARMLGKGMREVRKATTDFKDVVEGELYQLDEEIKGMPGQKGREDAAAKGATPAPAEGAVQTAPPAGAAAAVPAPSAVQEEGAPDAVAAEDAAAEAPDAAARAQTAAGREQPAAPDGQARAMGSAGSKDPEQDEGEQGMAAPPRGTIAR